MQLTVHGKQVDVGDAFRTHIGDKLSDIRQKYFNRAIDATVTISREGHGHGVYRALISIRVGKNLMVQADETAGEPYACFDLAADKIAKQLRRYKRRLSDHHEGAEDPQELLQAMSYVLDDSEKNSQALTEDEAMLKGQDPVIVAEMPTHIQTLSVGDAVMRMDLLGQTALLFRNAKHKGLNMVYRRSDGHVGWVDPVEEVKKA